MTAAALLSALAAALALGAACRGLWSGMFALNRVRLRLQADRGVPAARVLARALECPDSARVAMALAARTADFAAIVALVVFLLRRGLPLWATVPAATVIASPLIYALGAAMPEQLTRRQPERFVYPLWRLLAATLAVSRVTGLLGAAQALSRAIMGRMGAGGTRPEAGLPRTQLLMMLHEGAGADGLSPNRRDMAERVLALRDLRVARVMIPLARAVVVPRTISRADFLRVTRMAHFSRLPACADAPGRIVGIVNVYDVLTDATARPIEAFMRPPLFLGQSEPVSSALFRMQSTRQAMAIVVNPRQESIGIVTVKDLVEEIVGDLSAW